MEAKIGRFGAWGLGWRRVKEERWVGIWAGELGHRGVEEDRKK